MTVRINHLAVILAAVAYHLWGALWFMLWGSQWRSMTGRAMHDIHPATFLISFLTGLVMAYFVAIALKDGRHRNGASRGIAFGLFMGTGIWVTNLLSIVMYEGRPFGLWLIDGAYVVIGLALVGAIVGAWRKRA